VREKERVLGEEEGKTKFYGKRKCRDVS